MAPQLSLIGLELVVADLDRAVELWCDVLGFDLIGRGPSSHVVGEVATVDAGGLVLTLLAPAASGPGTVLSERTPRLGQLVVAGDRADDVDGACRRAVSGGLAVVPGGPDRFHLTPESVQGALGQAVAVVVTAVAAAGGRSSEPSS